MPVEEVEGIYENYKSFASRVNRESDGFFSTIRDKAINPDDAVFNLNKNKKTVNAADFFKKQKDTVASKKDDTIDNY